MPDLDPAAVWTLVADLDRLGEWAPIRSVGWSGDLPKPDDRFTVQVGVGFRSYSVRCTVSEWTAGRGYVVQLEGLPMTQKAELECRVESMVEGGAPCALVQLRYRAVVPSAGAGLARFEAQRRIKSALSRLQKLLA